MKNYIRILTTLILLIPMTASARFLDDIDWEAYAVVEDIYNVYGGIKTGSTYTLAGHIAATIPTKALHLWRDGQFTFGALGIQQNNYQYFYNGAIQSPSSYTGIPEVRISNLYYQQKFSKTIVRAGIMDIDDHFNQLLVASDNLMNSAFTNAIALSSNVLLATYPFPGVGCELAYDIDNWEIQTAIYQGNPKHQSSAFSKGFFIIGELKYDLQILSNRAEHYIFRFGIWDYQPYNSWLLRSERGLYSNFEITWKSKRGPHFGAAIQAGLAQEKNFSVPYSIAAALTVSHLFECRPHDSLNFGYGQAWLHGVQHHETFYEVDYIFKLSRSWKLILPDVQYFIKPSGTFRNSWVLLARLAYEYGGAEEIEF